MLSLTSTGAFEIKGRGTVLTIDNPEWGGPLFGQLEAAMRAHEVVEIDGDRYLLRGIERFAIANPANCPHYGLLVRRAE